MITIKDLRSFVRSQATRDSRNYTRDSWVLETNMIRRQRAAVNRDFGHRLRDDHEVLKPGNYWGGRLNISETSIVYCAGQYSPTEIWPAVYDYFYRTSGH